jgi:hypothetical protein
MQTKLKLNLDDLTVDSFDTTRPAHRQGTVFGEQCTCHTQCTCPGCPTCDASCNGTCGGTRGVACDTYILSCLVTDCYCGKRTCEETNCYPAVCCL